MKKAAKEKKPVENTHEKKERVSQGRLGTEKGNSKAEGNG